MSVNHMTAVFLQVADKHDTKRRPQAELVMILNELLLLGYLVRVLQTVGSNSKIKDPEFSGAGCYRTEVEDTGHGSARVPNYHNM